MAASGGLSREAGQRATALVDRHEYGRAVERLEQGLQLARDVPGAEAQHVHKALGLIDVSTLGKILVSGPDAGALSGEGPAAGSETEPGDGDGDGAAASVSV